VKTSSLGDVVHHCPAVSDAARHLPGARIDWVVEESFAGVARMHRAVANVIPVAVRRWRRRPWSPAVWREIRSFRERLKGGAYDAVVDTQGLLKSALITSWASGARHGMDRASAREPLAARFYEWVHEVPGGLHAVERNRRLSAASLGFSLEDPLDYGLKAPAAPPPALAPPYSVLLTMTSRMDKLWPEAHWIELGHSLGGRVVLPWGSPDERARAERIAAAVRDAVVPERMGIEPLAAVLAGARSVVGLDSGLTHLAAALAVPTVAIFCGSDPALTGLYGAARGRNIGQPGRTPAVAVL